jgi:lipopolysaccharide export system permease protein
MKIIDRYITVKYLSTFIFVVLLLTSVIVVIDVAEKIGDFVEKKIPMHEIIWDYYANFLAFMLNLFSPICVFITVIYITSQMAGQSEIVALSAGGISLYRLLLPYLGCSFILLALSFVLNLYIVPEANKKVIAFNYKYLKYKQIMEDRNIHKKIAPGTFAYVQTYNQYTNEGYLFSIEKFKDNVLIYKLNAQRINWVDSTQHWQISLATERYIGENHEIITRRNFIDTTLLLSPDDIFKKEMLTKSLTMPELRRYLQLERERASDYLLELETEVQERFAYPFAAVILTIIGLAMSSRKKRGGIALQIGLGLVFCFAYLLLVFTSQAFISERFPPLLAVWMPNILFGGLGIFLIKVAPK